MPLSSSSLSLLFTIDVEVDIRYTKEWRAKERRRQPTADIRFGNYLKEKKGGRRRGKTFKSKLIDPLRLGAASEMHSNYVPPGRTPPVVGSSCVLGMYKFVVHLI